MKALIFIFFLLIMLPASSRAEEPQIFSCSGTESYATVPFGKGIKYSLKVSYDGSSEKVLAFIGEDGKSIKEFDTFVYSGGIEMAAGEGIGLNSLPLIVTKKNHAKSGMSLTGSAIGKFGDVYTIRIDPWDKDTPFILFDVFNARIITGTCQ